MLDNNVSDLVLIDYFLGIYRYSVSKYIKSQVFCSVTVTSSNRFTFILYIHFHNMELHMAGWHVQIIFINFPQNLWKFDGSCSYIWHVNITNCVYWLDTQTLNVRWRFSTWSMNIHQLYAKFQNQEEFHNLQSHLACWYVKLCLFIRHTFCESLVMIYVTIIANAAHFCDIYFRYRSRKLKIRLIKVAHIIQ